LLQQPLPLRPFSMTGSDVDVSLPPQVFELRSPGSCKPRCNFDRKIRIVFARSQNRGAIFRPSSHCQATQAMRYHKHRCMFLLNGFLNSLYPLLPRRPIPIVLFHPPEIILPPFPNGLPMAWSRTVPAWNN